MAIEIKRWDTGAVIFRSETAETVKDALREGVQQGCSFERANLTYSDLTYADLRSANLTYADLTYANLTYSDLTYADLRSANLTYSDLRSADLRYSDLRSADLRYSDLRSADLRYTTGSSLAIARTRILPPEGEVIGWKKCREGALVKLRVPPEAKRSHAFGRKCRAEFVDVLEVVGAEKAVSIHHAGTEYVTGNRVIPHEWNEDWKQECAGGIHFYITKEEAEAHT